MCLDITLIMDKKIEIQSAVFERLINHLQKESSVQNIDMMILSGFCRNCLSRWYQEEAEKMGEEINPDEARKLYMGCHTKNGKKKIKNPLLRNN